MKKYLIYACLGVCFFLGAVQFFKSKSFETGITGFERNQQNDSGLSAEDAVGSKRATASLPNSGKADDSLKNGSGSQSDLSDNNIEEASASSGPAKYLKVKIEDKYAPAPEYVMKALAKQEIKMAAVAKKAQLEGDELVTCFARESTCISGSNESGNCVTNQRNCDGNSSVKKLTEAQLVKAMGRSAFEKYRNHLEFVEKTGSSIRGPGSLEKF
jgi:hypothetical protein